MNNPRDNHGTFIWTPLIGFEKTDADKGVAAYYDNIGFDPAGISLLFSCPDIVHQHDGMERERVLPPDHCSYLGVVRNDMRELQDWSNYDLRELIAGLEKCGAQTYLGIMGVFTNLPQSAPNQYNTGHREWLFDHPELMGVYTTATTGLNVLKRFKDGTYYEDFFLQKVRQALNDYGFSGLHAADKFCPPDPGGAARCGDFSNDMIAQFIEYSRLQLPAEILAPIDDQDRVGIERRAEFIWNRYQQQWLGFLVWRWAGFWKKICDGLHADGKKVMVNNAWCTDPFEAIYRFGIDYQRLHEAGVDWMLAESVPTSVHACGTEGERYHFYDYMTMPALMKAAVPDGKLLCLHSVNDATEEFSIIKHLPAHVEREIYTLTNFFLQTSNGLQRATDGLMVCLGDGMTRAEWAWLRQRWAIGFDEIPAKVLTPTLLWSNHALQSFLPDYIQTKRWTSHKTLYELAKSGGQIGAFARIEDLENVSGALFVPNIDLLSDDEIKAVAAYERGPIVCTSLVERNFQMPELGAPDLYFQDPIAEYQMCCFVYNLDDVDALQITSTLGEDDGSADIEGDPRDAEAPSWWTQDLPFRKVSTGFITACAKLIRACSPCELTTGINNPLLPLQMRDGRIRLLLGNDNRLQYRMVGISSKRAIKSVQSKSKFPAHSALLLKDSGLPIVPKSDGSHEVHTAYGFVAKIPPGGLTIFDVELEGGAP